MAKLKLKRPGDETALTFGKHRGRTPNEIAKDDPGYIVWLQANVLPSPCSRGLAVECEERVDRWRREDAEEEELDWRDRYIDD